MPPALWGITRIAKEIEMPWEPRPFDPIPGDAEEAMLHAAKVRKAEEEITRTWTSLNGVPGARIGDLMEIGIGFYRQYVNGRIYYNYHYSNALYVYGAIGEKYTQLGGPDSWLGWPTSGEEPFPQDGRVTMFGNGAIYWWLDTGAIELGNISLQYKGLYCFGETDEWSGSDEPYVVFGVVPTLPAQPSSVRTRVYDERGGVDRGNARPDYIELHRGLPYGALLGLVLCENDEGDPNAYLEQVKQGVALAGTAVTAGCGAVGGPAAAGICAAIWGGVGPEIVEFVNDTLGTGDDIIEKWDWYVTAKEMVTMARTPPRSFWGIDHHLESKLLSDGEASYKVYLGIYAV
jgi:hypothetical protein